MSTDNTQLNSNTTAGDIISTDAITTLNGGAITTGEKVQRVKAGFGVDGSLTDVSSTNPMPVVTQGGSSVTRNTLTSTGASQTLFSADPNRTGGQIFFDTGTSDTIVIKFGATASGSDFDLRLTGNSLYILPSPVYRGRIDVIWDSGSSGIIRGVTW